MENEQLEIDSRQMVFCGIHLIRQVPKGSSRRRAKSGEIRLVLRPDDGDDLVFVSHYHYDFRRKDIGSVRLAQPGEFDNHDFSLCARGDADFYLLFSPLCERPSFSAMIVTTKLADTAFSPLGSRQRGN